MKPAFHGDERDVPQFPTHELPRMEFHSRPREMGNCLVFDRDLVVNLLRNAAKPCPKNHADTGP